ncbi:hypothetical protein ACK3SF_01510 [Candidatus Nanosalina sp. VS9-1]|uniref:hypothetical protein n=1 Tax=Candidatus Nanosalina sp. VS9-1 TaxID=3388566 RepID=UPI0039E1050B
MAADEEEYMENFRESLTSAVSGYVATRLSDNLSGVPVYLGEDITDEEIQDAVNTAQDVLMFSEARVGQLAYAAQELKSQNGFRHYNVNGDDVKASEFSDMFCDRIQQFEDAEERIEYNMEVAEQQEGIPVNDAEIEASQEVPDFDIDDWRWPRENLWPF